ncbi:MAG TPA: DUF58 domain-containing protein [Ramlibacter sp.]|nr:DUF58 domain-containing protein [Ramlibacter sp.]
MSRFALRQRVRRWWQERLPVADTLTLTQRNVYIIPTRPGLMLAATLAVLLIASINYQLNLGYLLTFLLAGSTVVGMYVGHATLRGLRLSLAAPEPQFAGASASVAVLLINERKTVRHAVGVTVLDAVRDGRWAWADVPAQGSSSVRVAFQPPGRGLHQVPTLTAETRYPLGAFRVWTVWRPAARVLIYPAPEPMPPPLPPGLPSAGGAAGGAAPVSGEFDGVRAYRRGDTLRQVVWKKVAKADELVSRDTQQAQRRQLWLDHAVAGAGGLERRLSRLTAWVMQADRLGLDYGLRLPGVEIAPASGEVHRRRCLEALALC